MQPFMLAGRTDRVAKPDWSDPQGGRHTCEKLTDFLANVAEAKANLEARRSN